MVVGWIRYPTIIQLGGFWVGGWGVTNQYQTGCWFGGWFATNIQLIGCLGRDQPVSNWLVFWWVGRGYSTSIQLDVGLVGGGTLPISTWLLVGRRGG